MGKVSEKAIHFCDENNLQTSEPLDWKFFRQRAGGDA